MNDAHFIGADSSVVLDTLISLFLNRPQTCYGLWPPTTRITINTCPSSFESLHPSVNFPLAHTLNCHSSVNFTGFHTFWP